MRADDLDLRELLDFEPSGGILRFAGQRALLFDAVALGLLRRELIETLGTAAARGILTRFGFAHGWRTAEVLKGAFPWDSEREWQIAGGRLHRLQGLVVFEPVPPDSSRPRPFAQALWRDSYEAEQHLIHLGRSQEPVCWTLCGFASGYLSYCHGRQICCIEERCRGKGDALCSMVGKPEEEWGGPLESELSYFDRASFDQALKRAADLLQREERRARVRRPAAAVFEEQTGIVARSAAMRKVFDLARRVAQVDSTVLITGESGVGKEVVARFVHDESARAARPFVAVNCGAVPEGLLESELFGHARGAFTGATQDRPGLFEAAHGGTLFLDEIGDVPPSMQVKLLRVLQEREVRRVGENRNRPVDVRVVAATNREMAADVASGRFRQDLFYRLRVIEVRVPPLRERRDDILPLARTVLEAVARRTGRKVSGFTPAAAHQLLRYEWPGNVREIENVVERAVVLAQGRRVDLDDLPEEILAAVPRAYDPGQVRSLAEMERDYILAILRANGGNKARAAAQLGIGTATLFRKLKQYEEEGATTP